MRIHRVYVLSTYWVCCVAGSTLSVLIRAAISIVHMSHLFLLTGKSCGHHNVSYEMFS
jgi:hypothetical protein